MTNATRPCLLVVCLAAFLIPAMAEADEVAESVVNRAEQLRPVLEIAVQSGFPQGKFKGGTRFGASFFGGIGLRNLPLILGGEFGFPLREPERKTLEERSFSSVNAFTSSDVTTLHAMVRLQPASGRFRPYLDGLLGFKHFETRTRVSEDLIILATQVAASSTTVRARSATTRTTPTSPSVTGWERVSMCGSTRPTQSSSRPFAPEPTSSRLNSASA